MDRFPSRPARALTLTLAILSALAGTTHATQPGTPPDPIRRVVTDTMNLYDVPGLALARIAAGNVVWIGTFGRADANRPVTRQTLFNVASLTKPMFAVMVMHLIQDGRTTLDEPLANGWVDPDIQDDPRHRQLTARLSLSHQTGLPNWRGNNPLFFMFDPGTRHEYSGEGFEYLRRALERRTGQSMDALMSQYVTGPLNLNHTHYGWHRRLEPRIATGYDESASPLDVGYLEHRSTNAAANTFTTIGDYADFAAWVAGGAGLSDAGFREMTSLQSQHDDPWEFFGLGWRLLLLDDRTVLEHDGRESGVRTQVFIDPESGDGLVILTNSSNGELVVRPLLEATWPKSDDILHQRDTDTWHYLQSLPGSMHWNMVNFIAGSPSFTLKLLHAAQVGLIEPSGLSDSELARARAAIDDFVVRMHRGELSQADVMNQLMILGSGEGKDFRLDDHWTSSDSKVWINRLLDVSAEFTQPGS
ncbi:serine hydrolase domain-containing protein [Saccharospirillum salsuginis]|uniref:Beta-lactamase-related domain-containing protein n=1 Tax=Saccharospirillum salsuginis TaxID=418750 RepID=A0A918K2E3_9GAMM|nr:serine hydrolase domain-containing protein [Saccharospirillum salsuginis]GGX43048.1 hypothetical protein GCM10007392_07170 [Saccharospirillum salsuginis]